MNSLYIIVALVAAFATADDEPFSIGLGVLSPSYSQSVGPENVKVNFEQKDGGFSYSVGDPKSGSNTYLNFGSAAGNQAINPAGYADANPSALAGPSPFGYAGSASAYQQPSPSGFGSLGYGSAGLTGFYNGPNPSGPYAGPSHAGPYNGPSAAGPYNGPSAAGPHSYTGGESARKPEEPAQILPAGFSYHGTEGQSFLNHGEESPNFMVSDERQESARGPAEKSFVDNFNVRGQQGPGRVLANGLVGYGPGGRQGSQQGSLPVGGYAGPQFAGLVREHGGHE